MRDWAYLFFTFLKIGATAFGGYMSLVAIVQKQLVEIDHRLKEEDLLDAISLASMLPGPVAVNVIANVGYRMGGAVGAAAAFIGILLPALLLVIVLSALYFTYGNVPVVKNLFAGITPVVTALILTVAIGMARKTMKQRAQWGIGVLSALLLSVVGGFLLTFGLLVASGLLGFLLFRRAMPLSGGDRPAIRKSGWRQWMGMGCLLLFLAVCLLGGTPGGQVPLPVRLLATFSGISLTLFGGGYVVIPALHELFVDNLCWLDATEFADGIAIGQVTPGPIFITAAFIGYKVAGIGGSLMATAGMFIPPALLTVALSRFVEPLKRSAGWQAALQGIRAAVVGMIFASGFTIGRTLTPDAGTILLFVLAFLLSYRYPKISPIYLILGAGLWGILFF